MDPLTMMGIGMGAGAIGNIFGGIWGSNENAKATQQLMDRLKELQDRVEREWKLPEYDRTPFTPEEFKLLENYTPEIAQFIKEESPDLLRKVSSEASQNRDQVMNRLKEMSNDGSSPATRAAAERAELEATSAQKGRVNDLMRSFNQRGLAGSGQELVAGLESAGQLAYGQRASALAQEEGENQRRMEALSGLGQFSNQIVGEDNQRQAANNQILNQYNQRLTDRRQNYEGYRSNTLNQANMYNQQNRQNVSNQNTGLRNNAEMYNRNREDEYNREKIRAMNDKLRMITGLGTQYANTEYGGKVARNQATAGMIGAGGNMIGAIGGLFSGAGGSSQTPSPAYPSYADPFGSNRYNLGVNRGY